MKLLFTRHEMIEALESIGYRIIEEEEIEYISHPGYEEERPYKVYNCYYGNQCMTTEELGFRRLGGFDRVERVFNHELQKRLLKLFL